MIGESNIKKGIVFFIYIIFFIPCHFGRAETITIISDKDTYIDQLFPDNNFGQAWKILISGDGGDARGLFHFDLSGMGDTALIEDAKLTFLIHSNPSTNTYFYHPLSTFWEEDSATWNQAETGMSWETQGGDFDPDTFLASDLPASIPGWMVADVTPLVSDQGGNLNSGIAENGLLVRADTGFSKILSSEFSTYGNVATCHSCHGAKPPELDEGKSSNCSACHAQGEIPLAGEPALIFDYQPMLFQFVQVSDTHIGKNPPRQADNLYHAVAQINEINPAFVLFTGDLTDSGTLEQYATFKGALSGLKMPYHCVPGDNDIIDGEGDLKRYREQLGDDYYAFDYQGFNFIGLNNNFHLSLDEDQRLWLEGELKEGKSEMAFAHRPLLYSANGEPIPESEQLLSLFENHHVTMYMNGHEHITAQHTLNGTYHIWCDNLSWFHSGEETYNLYRVYSDRILLFHFYYDGSKEFAGSFPLSLIIPDLVVTEKVEEWIDPNDPSKGYRIHYTVENHGTEVADESVTCLFINDINAGSQFCPALKPHPDDPHSYSGTFEGPFYCVGQSDLIKVCADYGTGCDGVGTVEEGNEDNNCMQNEWPCALNLLDIRNGAGEPGSTDSVVEVSLTNAVDIAGIQVDICNMDNYLSLQSVELTDRTAGFTCDSQDDYPQAGCARLVLYSQAGSVIEEGDGSIFILHYDVTADATANLCVELTPDNLLITDEKDNPLTAAVDPGSFFLGIHGDPWPFEAGSGQVGDGLVNIFDVVRDIQMILETYTPTPCEFAPADVPTGAPPDCVAPDEIINIQDILVMVARILARPNCIDQL